MIEILETIREAVRERRDDLRVEARAKDDPIETALLKARALALNDLALALSDAINKAEKEAL